MADNFLYAQLQTFFLAGSGATTGATSIILSSMKDIDGNALTMSTAFGTKGFITLEPNNSTQEEQISFTGLTNNSNGTTTLTGVKSVTFLSPYTETSGLAKSHPGGSKAIVSNTSGFYNELTSKDDDETINGLYTFVQFPQKSGSTTPTAAAELASKAYVDSVAGGVAVTNQLLVTGTAGENLTAGYIVGKKLTDGKFYIVKANDTSTFSEQELGIAQSTVLSGATVNILLAGVDSNQTGLVAGTEYFATDAGGFPTSSFSATNLIFIGYGQSATTLLVSPRNIDFPLHTEKQALVGTSGTPSSTNLFVTANDVSTAGTTGKIIRAVTTTGTNALPAISAISVKSVPISALFIASQVIGAVIYKKSTNGWGIKGPGAAGTSLQSQGAGADPKFAFSPLYANGVSSRAGDTASGSQTIAHGLGTTPRFVRLTCRKLIGANSTTAYSDGTYNGTTTAAVYISNVTAGNANTSSTNIIFIDDGSTTGSQVATITVDATNINLTWTKTSSPSANNIYIMFEVQA